MPSAGCVTGIVLTLIVQLRMATSQSSTIAPADSSSSDVTTFTSPSSFTSSDANTAEVTNMTTLAPSSIFSASTNATATTITEKSSNNSTGTISCRTFTCNSSMCYSIYLNTTARPCSPDALFCELWRLDGVMYSANCSAFCNVTANRCANSTMTSCSVDCCNSTDCLNSTLASLMITTTVTPVTTETTQTTASTLTTAKKNGKKCHKLNCGTEKCYQTDIPKPVLDCFVGQDFCKLSKTGSSWEAGCSGNCTGDKSCGSTAVNCTQECCSPTIASGSCLKLDGSVNMPNSAVVLHTALSLFPPCLLIWALGFCFLIG